MTLPQGPPLTRSLTQLDTFMLGVSCSCMVSFAWPFSAEGAAVAVTTLRSMGDLTPSLSPKLYMALHKGPPLMLDP